MSESKLVKVELRVSIFAWEESADGPVKLPSEVTKSQIVFSEESATKLRTMHNLDGASEMVRAWWRELKQVLPGKLQSMARKALGV